MTDAQIQITSLGPTFEAIGLVLDLLSRHPPFAEYRLARIGAAVRRQLELRQNVAAVDDAGRLVGYVGWSYALPASATLWVEDRGPLKVVPNRTEAVALTIVVSPQGDSIAAMVRQARLLNPGVRVYFKRSYGGDLRSPRKASIANAGS
ncbi:MAG: hypothetical protein JWQ89_3289 [Devosia sp.]|uniref:hypothetical protein n=1 Tax=Devosia sp. TaxID=1871048 RepID=UPI00260A7663|nr:hypothetical protein [Devosia sp.]MDB5541562.1 hypothetical protein [Devosia sp.]